MFILKYWCTARLCPSLTPKVRLRWFGPQLKELEWESQRWKEKTRIPIITTITSQHSENLAHSTKQEKNQYGIIIRK